MSLLIYDVLKIKTGLARVYSIYLDGIVCQDYLSPVSDLLLFKIMLSTKKHVIAR